MADVAQPVCFGPFRLVGPAGPLFRNGVQIPLRAKSIRTLWLLAERGGQPVSKDELTEAIWGGKVVSESSLSVCIREIREALGDDPRSPRYVQTMHRHGYRFIGHVSGAGRATPHAHFVGRHAEWEQLDGEFEAMLGGEHRLVLVSGHAGVGKTALIDAWRAASRARTEARIVVGRCIDQSGASEAYLPFLDALRRMTGGADAEDVLMLMRRCAPSWLLQFPSWIGDNERDALSAAARGADAARMRRELADLLSALSADRPLVLVLEDMHWCDASSAAALAFIARDERLGRLLVIASFRRADVLAPGHALSKVRGELKVRNLCTEIELGALAAADVGSYLEGRLEDRCSRELACAVYRRTEGHPLFMVTLADQLAADAGRLSPEAMLDGTAPPDLVTFIELRLADLDPTEREMLEAASVAGEIFATAEIDAAVERAEGRPSADRLCERIARRGEFLDDAEPARWPDGTLTGCYRFRHALYAEVIRSTIGRARRAHLHRRIGERLERGHEVETAAIAATLAHHFDEARDIPRAAAYLIDAANTDVARHAHAEAAALLKRGLDLVGSMEDAEERAQLELKLLLALGPVQVALEGYGAAAVEATFAKARELCTLEVLAGDRFPVLRGLAAFHHLRADFATAHALGTELIALGRAADPPDDGHLVEGHLICGMVDFFCGRLTDADQALRRSIAHYDRERHAAHADIHGIDPGTLGLGFEALTSWMLGDGARARAKAETGLALAEVVDHPLTLCQGHAMAALLHQFRGDLQQTRHHSEQASEIAATFGFSFLIASERARCGWLCAQSGNPDEGIDDIRAGIALYRDTGAVGGLTIIMSTLVEAYLLTGDLDRGLETVDEALSLARYNYEGVYEAELLRLHGELLRSLGGTGNTAAAEEHLSSSLTVARRQQAQIFELRTTISLARLWQEQGREEEARRLLLPILAQVKDSTPSLMMTAMKDVLGSEPCYTGR